MTAKWKQDFNSELIANRIESRRSWSGDGNVGIDIVFAEELLETVFAGIELDHSVPDADGRQVVHSAVFAALKKGVLTSNSLLTEVSKQEKKPRTRHRYR